MATLVAPRDNETFRAKKNYEQKKIWKFRQEEGRKRKKYLVPRVSEKIPVLPWESGIWTSVTWPWWFGFRLMLISGNYRVPPEIAAHSKICRKCHKNNHIASFTKDTLCRPEEDLSSTRMRSEFKITTHDAAVQDDNSTDGTLTDYFQYGSVISGFILRSTS